MISQGLAFEQAPPLSVPFRFFLTAPVFGMLAGLLLLWQGPEALSFRWNSAALALTHLVVLGFATMSMAGALMQMLPVLAGAPVSQPRITAWGVHLPLAAGALLLPAGFLTGHRGTLVIAAVLLAAALGLLTLVLAWSLARAPVRSATVSGLRHATAGLAVAASLGVILALRRAGIDPLPEVALTPLHVAWGLVGWILLLVVAVAYQVVPMFQLTPAYPGRLARWLPAVLLAGLMAWSWAVLRAHSVAPLLAAVPVIGGAVFAVVTLRIQARRRRGRRDYTLLFWRLAMACLIGACALWTVQSAFPGFLAADAALPIGVLALGGVAFSVVNGMLYKIVPFLAWFHLQALAGGRWKIPNMREALPESDMRLQFAWHCAALAALAAGVAWPGLLSRAAGAVLAVSSALLARNLARTGRLYRKTRERIEALRRLENPGGVRR
ncbi:MAG TPA: hypothetical protein VF104_09155 [Burkholderiales bacterium]